MMPLLAALALLQASPAAAPLPSDPVPADWRAIPDDQILVMTLAGGHQVVIRLAADYTPAHVANIRKLALAHWWDNSAVYRVQENWVTQWGDPTEKKALPEGVAAKVTPEFEISRFAPAQRLAKADAYSTTSGYTADGWPVASDGGVAWLTHCYGMVGVARDSDPESGSGSELFTPIGQSARRLDRNYTVVGRVIEGMEYLSGLTRSDAPMGMYAQASEYTPIVSVRLASDIPAAQRPHFQYRATDNPRFAALIAMREHPKPPMVGGGAEVCDIALGARRAP
jgi:peptidylprolyl isomerase